jgi:hypothetical protein
MKKPRFFERFFKCLSSIAFQDWEIHIKIGAPAIRRRQSGVGLVRATERKSTTPLSVSFRWTSGKVAEAVVAVSDAPFGKRPFRVHIDPTQDGAEVAFAVSDRVRTEMLPRVGLDELLSPVKD